jgi:hypothetical protein
MRPLLAGAALAAALAGAAPAQAPAAPVRPTPAQQGHCRAGETVVYSCKFGRATGSVCAHDHSAPGRLSYRFGPLGKAPELDIVSAPDWSNLHIGRITGGGGGYQNHMRFSARGHDYIVFEAVNGSLTVSPGHRRSGISVWRGATEFPPRACGLQTGGTVGTFADVWKYVPTASRSAVEERDSRFEAWF